MVNSRQERSSANSRRQEQTQQRANEQEQVRVPNSSSEEGREDDFSNVESKRMHYKNHEVVVRFNRQNPDIAGGVHDGNDDLDVSTGDGESCSGMRVLWHLTLTDGRKDD